jgi:RNA recognition motif-containing protein
MSVPQQPTTTIFFGNLDQSKVDREMLFEIAIQAGPVTSVHIPIDQASGKSKGFGFVVRASLFVLPFHSMIAAGWRRR